MPRVNAGSRAAHKAMQNASVLHPLKPGIPVKEVPGHLARIVVGLLSEVDTQARNTGEHHLIRHTEMCHAGGISRR